MRLTEGNIGVVQIFASFAEAQCHRTAAADHGEEHQTCPQIDGVIVSGLRHRFGGLLIEKLHRSRLTVLDLHRDRVRNDVALYYLDMLKPVLLSASWYG